MGVEKMSGRLIIVSNRLPYSFSLAEDISCTKTESKASKERAKEPTENEAELFSFTQSSGGLVSGLKPLSEEKDTLWVGWADTHDMTLDKEQRKSLVSELETRGCVPVFLEKQDAENYYDGFSNSAIWPLFHYFSQFCNFDQQEWQSYKRVNEVFCKALVDLVEPEDTIWVHDYHLMLLPELIRQKAEGVSIGFFLHIPFPSSEMFRILPCRSEILKGILGADLIGFHTYDYTRHFLSSCRRVLGIENQYGTITYDGRMIQTDAFPLGIDYDLYSSMAHRSDVKKMANGYIYEKFNGGKVILSIERLDYSKGILDSLNAYDAFLASHPQWIEKVVLILVVVPSRENVESYQDLKCQVDELVGAIEGKYSTQKWTPVDYYYRSFPLEELCGMYLASDVMMVTPLRDGMNLISKEYLAVHANEAGVLILSEMAGSAYELSDAIIINPFNQTEYVDAIEKALTMPESEQKKRNSVMQKRLEQYTSKQWAMSFMETLTKGLSQQDTTKTLVLDKTLKTSLAKEYKCAEKRAIILDYDGTLVGFKNNPEDAYPDEELLELLTRLCENRRNNVVIISGRDRETLDKWFGHLPIDMISEHGIWQYSHESKNWVLNEPLDDGWKKGIYTVLENFVIRTPGSFIEEKNYSLVWHCRGATEELGQRRMREINMTLALEAESRGLMIMQGNKVIEIKPQSINKGRAAYSWMQDKPCDFILAAGDDTTDEDMFHILPDDAWTIKVGMDTTEARFYLEESKEVRQLLQRLV